MVKLLYYANPYDIKCKEMLSKLFDGGIYPLVIERTSPENDGGYWISYIPTVLLVDEAGKECARVEDVNCTPAAVGWVRDNASAIAAGTIDKSTAPQGVRFP